MYSRKIYATGAASANAVASITVPTRSKLVAVQWCVELDSITDNSSARLELSRSSATEIAINDAQQCISEVRGANNLLTSGMQFSGINITMPVDEDFAQGEKVYLHVVIVGVITYTGGAILWFR